MKKIILFILVLFSTTSFSKGEMRLTKHFDRDQKELNLISIKGDIFKKFFYKLNLYEQPNEQLMLGYNYMNDILDIGISIGVGNLFNEKKEYILNSTCEYKLKSKVSIEAKVDQIIFNNDYNWNYSVDVGYQMEPMLKFPIIGIQVNQENRTVFCGVEINN